MLEFSAEYRLSYDGNKGYRDIAFNSSRTFLLTDEKQIHILNESLTGPEITQTSCHYHSFCFDNADRCFWAVSDEQPGTLFQLTENFEVTDRYLLQLNGKAFIPQQLFSDQQSGGLFIQAEQQLMAMDKSRRIRLITDSLLPSQIITGISACSGLIFCILSRSEGQFCAILSSADGTVLTEISLDTECPVIALTLLCHSAEQGGVILRLLEKSPDGTCFMSDYRTEEEFLRQVYSLKTGSDEKISSSSDVRMQQLGAMRFPCPFFCQGPRRPNQCRPYSCQPGCNNSFSPCDPCSPDNGCCTNSPCDCNENCGCFPPAVQTCNDILESIALTEASIAHILNAEGEKLQKAIASTSSINDLLKINESVMKTIIHSTHLEQVLYNKLNSVLNADFCNCTPCIHPCDEEMENDGKSFCQDWN